MQPSPHIHRAENFFTLAGLTVLVFVWFALSLGVSGLFFTPLIAFGFSLSATLILFLILKAFSFLKNTEKLFLSILIGLASLNACTSSPSVFTGRDQGSIATAAIALADQHAFHFSLPVAETFFSLYGPGLAYNFPGFFYTEQGELLTQFPPAYTAWLGSFYALFGLPGFVLANVFLLVLSLLTFYFLLRHFLHPLIAFCGSLLLGTSFLPTWFSKFTLTENLALFLFLFLIFALVRFRTEGKFLQYAAILSAAGILFFTRIEGLIILPITCLILAFSQHTLRLWKRYPWKSLIAPSLLFLLTLFASFSDMLPFYTTIGKASLHFIQEFTPTKIQTSSALPPSLSLFPLSFIYGFFFIFTLGILNLLFFLWQRRLFVLIPFFIAAPTFVYLLFPNITPDHPWMLRRYLSTIYPTLLFFAIVGIQFLFTETKSFPLNLPKSPRRRFILALTFIGLLAFQSSAWHQALSHNESSDLLKETHAAASLFGPRDLILVDREVSGSGYRMIAGPLASLFQKNAVYFFNPEDFPKLDRSLYAHTWLITPTENAASWTTALATSSLTPRATLTFASVPNIVFEIE